jgi:hypothetical protein
VMVVGEQRFTVRPPALRYVLVSKVFFRDVRLPIERILARVPSVAFLKLECSCD